LVMDFSPWYGNALTDGFGPGPQTGQTWTSNSNLGTLIDHMNTLLAAGQLSATFKQRIIDFLMYERTISSMPVSNPCSITTSAAHGLTTGDGITISGVSGGTFSPAINANFTVTVTGLNTFTVPSNHSAGIPTLTNARISYVPYTNTAPTDLNKRDRMRAIIHFILTSPDFTIQR
jgi:hypothetical protein